MAPQIKSVAYGTSNGRVYWIACCTGDQFTLPGSEFIVNLPIAYAYAYAIDLFYIYFIGA